MGKFYGPIGYAKMVQTKPGVWEEQITERNHFGDVITDSRRLESSGQLNESVNITKKISIIADPFANENYLYMRYVKYMGVKWRISDVNPERPRLILTLGGVYNG